MPVHYNSHEIGDIPGGKPLHGVGAMEFYSPLACPQRLTRHPVRGPLYDQREDRVFPRCKTVGGRRDGIVGVLHLSCCTFLIGANASEALSFCEPIPARPANRHCMTRIAMVSKALRRMCASRDRHCCSVRSRLRFIERSPRHR